eukprot:s7197_g3.t1
MTRTRKWVSCACGHNWTWQRQVETGEDTHCAVCGRNWRKQLRKQQSSKDGWVENSPRVVWEAGRSSGKGKGEGKGLKGQPGPPGGKATNQMKNLVEKKAKLQARADKLKQELEMLIGDVDQVDKDITVKDAEIQETAKAFKDLTADSTSTAFRALETVLAEAGHELSEATRAKMKATLVRKDDFPEDPFLARWPWLSAAVVHHPHPMHIQL